MKLSKATDNRVLSFELLLPVSEHAKLLVGEAVEGAADVFVVLGHLGEGAGGVLAGEYGVGAAGTVEGLARGDVEDAALDGDVDGFVVVGAVESLELLLRYLHGLFVAGFLFFLSFFPDKNDPLYFLCYLIFCLSLFLYILIILSKPGYVDISNHFG